jgi:hypothetical protein
MSNGFDHRFDLPLGLVGENKGLDKMLDDMAKIPLPDINECCGNHFCTCNQATPDDDMTPGFDCEIIEMPKPR